MPIWVIILILWCLYGIVFLVHVNRQSDETLKKTKGLRFFLIVGIAGPVVWFAALCTIPIALMKK